MLDSSSSGSKFMVLHMGTKDEHLGNQLGIHGLFMF